MSQMDLLRDGISARRGEISKEELRNMGNASRKSFARSPERQRRISPFSADSETAEDLDRGSSRTAIPLTGEMLRRDGKRYKVPELKAFLKERGLPITGAKNVLLQRLILHVEG